MSPKPWQLSRRTLLRGLGVACAVPYLEGMTWARQSPVVDLPKRLCFVYFPNGCSLPEESDAENRKWRWFPDAEGEQGTGYRFTEVLSSLEPYREQVSILGGLSHPRSRNLLGHLAGDTWLTAGDLRGDHYRNGVSVDQVAARGLKRFTRYPSLVLSTDGGVGYKSRVSTLSFDPNGRPIPSENRQREIFERYFSPNGQGTSAERKRSLLQGKKVVDLVLEDSKRLRRRLGKADQDKLDDYVNSLGSVEEQIRRNEAWLDVPMKPFDAGHLQLDVDPKVDPEAYLRATFDLIVLGFQTDITRVVTYMMGREDGMGFGDRFPKLALGIKKGHHTISHDNVWEEWGSFDRWYAQQFARFVGRMQAVSDENGPLLDNTLILYGSCCSTTHNARNYPLALVGGKSLGVRHGRYTKYEEKSPMSNLFVSLLKAVDVPVESFADSTGPLPGLFG